MLINGKESPNNTAQILEKLSLLPSSFPNYKNTSSIIPLSPEEHKSYSAAVQSYNDATKKAF